MYTLDGYLTSPAVLVTMEHQTHTLASRTPFFFAAHTPGLRALELRDETPIWAIQGGCRIYGWVRAGWTWSASPNARLANPHDTALDLIRYSMAHTPPRGGYNKRGEPFRPYSTSDWLMLFGPLLEPAVRNKLVQELSLDAAARRDARIFVRQLIRTLVSYNVPEEALTMSKIQETHDELKVEHDQLAEAKKATTKKKVAKTAKPAEKKAAKPAKGARKGVAMEHIRAALKSAKAPTALQALATDAPSKMALSQLQKGINELASAKREKEQGEAASQLSSINRIVRRMLRAMK